MKYIILLFCLSSCAESLCYSEATNAFKAKSKECREQEEPKTCRALAEHQYDLDDEQCMREYK